MANKTKSTKTNAPEYYYAVGRRKRAIARIRLYPKTTKSDNIDIIVNDKPVGQYFSNPQLRSFYAQPLELTKTLDRFHATVRIEGSGLNSQLEAMLHAMSRALVKVDETFKPTLKKHGLLTRDPRERQRRMIGTGGKSRRQKQSPKR